MANENRIYRYMYILLTADWLRTSTNAERHWVFAVASVTIFPVCLNVKLSCAGNDFAFGRHPASNLSNYFHATALTVPDISPNNILRLWNTDSILRLFIWIQFRRPFILNALCSIQQRQIFLSSWFLDSQFAAHHPSDIDFSNEIWCDTQMQFHFAFDFLTNFISHSFWLLLSSVYGFVYHR